MKRLLVVEDELALQKVLMTGLKLLGYSVDGASDGQEALDLYYENQYDLIVLDLNLPYIDGIELLDEFRKDDPGVKIIILSARSEVEDKIQGLNLGANDYLEKPFNFDELVARINGLLRREFIQHKEVITLGSYQLDTAKRELMFEDNLISISNKEYALLYLLLTNQKRCLEAYVIEASLWGETLDASDRLKVLINKLRKKLPTNIIKNKWGVGYYVEET